MSNEGCRAAGRNWGRVPLQELVTECEVPLGKLLLLAEDPKCGVCVGE